MPLRTSSDPANVDAVAKSDADYFIFYSSIDSSSQMWCPDCRRVEGIVRTAFEDPDAPSALIVYIGQRDDWKGKSSNPFRGSPWNVSSVPTILRRDGARLVDNQINEETLKAFISA